MFTQQLQLANRYPGVTILIAVITVLDLVLRAFALWKAIKNNHMYWFVALFVINSVGILPAAYLLFFQPKSTEKVEIQKHIKSASTKTKSKRASKRR